MELRRNPLPTYDLYERTIQHTPKTPARRDHPVHQSCVMQLLGVVKGLVSTMTDRTLSSSPLEGATDAIQQLSATALQLSKNVTQQTTAIRDLTQAITSMNERQMPAQAPVPTVAEPRRMSAPGKENCWSEASVSAAGPVLINCA